MRTDRRMTQQWPLVGRAELLGTMTAAIRSNASSVVILCGPSGVGKSRLAAEAGNVLAADNWHAVPVTASETIASIPLGALIPAIGASGIDLAAASRNSIALFDEVRAALQSAAAGRPLLLIIDDLSLLDSLSLAVITQLIGAGAVRLIATVRTGDPLPDAILSMWTSNSALRIEVPPLTVEEYEHILHGVLGGPVSHRTAADLHTMSGGNPLFLRELVVGAVEGGQLSPVEGVWQLVGEPLGTPALHDLIRSRLRHLDADELAIVQRLAVCQPLSLDDIPGADARRRAVELEAAGLISVTESGSRILLSLAHPQYISAVKSGISRLRIIDILLEQADIIAARPMSPDDELRVATWRLDAGRPSDPDLLSRAAHLALIAEDHAAVARLAEAAIEAGAHSAEMLFLQGEANWTLGRNSEALDLLERAAIADAEHPTTVQLTGLIATARASTYAGEHLGNSRGLEVLDDATTRHPSLARTLALSRAVLLLNLEEAELAAIELVSALPEAESEEGRAAVLALSTALPLSALGKADEAILAARAAVEHATTNPTPAFVLRRAQMVLATVLLQAGETAEAKSLAMASLHDGIQYDDELTVRYNEFLIGRCFLALGRLQTAVRWFRDTMSGAQARGPIAYRDQAKAQLVLALAWQGKTTEATELFATLSREYVSHSSTATLAGAWLDAVSGDREGAIDVLLTRATDVASRGHNVHAAALLHAAARLGATEASALLTPLAARTDSALITWQAAHAAAQSTGDQAALVAIGERFETAGMRLLAAEAFASASASARRDESSRAASALQNRVDKLVATTEGGATPLLQFAEQSEPLTKREREIAALAALGLTSIEIAEKLFLSPRTVNNHLQAAYTKLGIRGRGELAGL